MKALATAYNYLRMVDVASDLRAISFLHYEQLAGTNGMSSIRVVNGMVERILFREFDGGISITVFSEESNPASYNVETNTFTLVNPTRMGYDFTGWTGSNGSTPRTTVTIEKGSTTGVLTYMARWKTVKYTITYDLDGGSPFTPIGVAFTRLKFCYNRSRLLKCNTC